MALQTTIAEQQIVKTVSKISIDTIIFRFYEGDGYAVASCTFYDADDVFVKADTVEFSENELSGWGPDDNFIVELVKQKFGMA